MYQLAPSPRLDESAPPVAPIREVLVPANGESFASAAVRYLVPCQVCSALTLVDRQTFDRRSSIICRLCDPNE